MIKSIFKKIIPQSVITELKIRHNRQLPVNQSYTERENGLKDFYKRHTGDELDFSKVSTYNEKIQWLKLYYNHPDLSKIVCKYNFKKYIFDKFGEGYTVPLYGVWSDVNKIDFNKLPEQFVLKSNCASNGRFIKIVKDKSSLDICKLKEELKGWLNPSRLMINTYCRAYWDVKPLIIAEKYIEQIDGQTYDYKFFCFGGEPKFAYVATDHFDEGNNIENHRISIYDLDWNLMDVKYGEHPQNNVPAPKNLAKMIELAKEASKEFPFVRVDFFEIEDKVYFSELTFYPGGGLHKIHPEHINKEWGSYMSLPEKKDIHKSHRYILK